jgi:WD40 repeat protein/tRNA A-37 threonylcarbamoyl transferase component Bud32
MDEPGLEAGTQMAPRELTPDMGRLRAGTALDHFRILRFLGEGSMGEVYLARDTVLGRRVALKVIKAARVSTTAARQRFADEARATARFNHPHIVTIHEVGEAGGRPYVALEFLEGQTLAQRLAEQRPAQAEAVRIGRAVASAMAEAHAQGIQHRDLKPANVFLSQDGRVRVLDFGLARPELASGDPDRPSGDPRVSQSSPSGTPAYMAPEQWRGEPVTVAADVWALGVILFELVAGQRPYLNTDPVAIGEQVLAPEPPPPVDAFEPCAADLAQLVADCLRKDPGGRPQASEVRGRLDRLLTLGRTLRETPDGPFRGLMPFAEAHSQLFFGREAEVAAFVERLRGQPVQVVVGASGAGKSSFVHAGVLPRLRERGPLVALSIRPGADPFLSLAAEVLREDAGPAPEQARALGGRLRESPRQLNLMLQQLAEQRDSSVVLVVDQLEELYTLGHEAALRQAFMSAVCNAADVPELPVRVVLVLREEFLSAVADGAGVRDCLGSITVLRSPGADALTETLVRPVELAGLRYEDAGLVGRMVDDVAGEPACLPLLQFTGRMLWERRDRARGLLTHEAYESIGGVAGALARHADGVLGGMTRVEVGLARTLLLRLVTPDGTRRTRSRSALLDGLAAAAGDVLQRLVAARLVTGRQSPDRGEELRELVHESLIVAWSRLARWIDEGREERVLFGELEQAASLWERRGCPRDEVWQGDALRDAERLLANQRSELTSSSRRFVLAGVARGGRQQRRKRVLIGALFVQVAVIAILLAGSALDAQRQRRDAELARDQARVAEQAARSNLAWSLAERAASTPGMHEATLYAAASLTEQENPMARGLLAGLVNRPRPSLTWQGSPGMACREMAISPAASRLFCVGGEPTVRTLDLSSGVEGPSIDTEGEAALALALSPGGGQLAVGHADGVTRVFDVASGEVLQRLPGQRMAVLDVSWSEYGTHLAAASSDGSVVVWFGPELSEVRRLDGTCAGPRAVALSAFGDRVYVGCASGAVEVWPLDSPDGARVLEAHEGEVVGVAVLGLESRVVSFDDAGHGVVWDVDRGEKVRQMEGCDALSGAPALLADRRHVAFPCNDGSVRILSTLGEGVERGLTGHDLEVTAIAQSPDGSLLVTSALDASVVLWDGWDHGVRGRILGVDGRPIAAYITADGSRLVVGNPAGVFRVFTLADGSLERVVQGEAGQRVALSDDGRTLAVGTHSGDFYLVDLPSGEEIHRRPAADGAWVPMRFCSDGSLLVEMPDSEVASWRPGDVRPRTLARGPAGTDYWIVATPDCARAVSVERGGPTTVWDLTRGRPDFVTAEQSPYFRLAEFSRDQRWLVTGDSEGMVEIWDVQRGERLHRLVGHHGVVYTLDFSPDGSVLASGGADKAVRLWDVATGRELGQLRHDEIVAGLGFPADGGWLMTLDDHMVTRLWDLDADTPEPILRGHLDLVSALAFDRSGRTLVSVDHAGGGLSWDLAAGSHEPFETGLTGPAYVRFFGSSGTALATSAASEQLQVWSMDPPRQIGELERDGWHLLRTVLLDQGQVVLEPAEEGGLQLLDRRDGSVRPIAPDPDLVEPFKPILVSATADERRAVAAGASGLLYLIDLQAAAPVAQAQGPRLMSVAIDPGGTWIAGATRDGVIRVWAADPEPAPAAPALAPLTPLATLDGHENLIAHLALSPDGRWLASAGWDKTVRVWRTEDWQEVATLTGYGRSTLGVAFSPDSTLLATAQDDHSIRLWEIGALEQPVDRLLERVASESGLVWDGRRAVADPQLELSRVVWLE